MYNVHICSISPVHSIFVALTWVGRRKWQRLWIAGWCIRNIRLQWQLQRDLL